MFATAALEDLVEAAVWVVPDALEPVVLEAVGVKEVERVALEATVALADVEVVKVEFAFLVVGTAVVELAEVTAVLYAEPVAK